MKFRIKITTTHATTLGLQLGLDTEDKNNFLNMLTIQSCVMKQSEYKMALSMDI